MEFESFENQSATYDPSQSNTFNGFTQNPLSLSSQYSSNSNAFQSFNLNSNYALPPGTNLFQTTQSFTFAPQNLPFQSLTQPQFEKSYEPFPSQGFNPQGSGFLLSNNENQNPNIFSNQSFFGKEGMKSNTSPEENKRNLRPRKQKNNNIVAQNLFAGNNEADDSEDEDFNVNEAAAEEDANEESESDEWVDENEINEEEDLNPDPNFDVQDYLRVRQYLN